MRSLGSVDLISLWNLLQLLLHKAMNALISLMHITASTELWQRAHSKTKIRKKGKTKHKRKEESPNKSPSPKESALRLEFNQRGIQ